VKRATPRVEAVPQGDPPPVVVAGDPAAEAHARLVRAQLGLMTELDLAAALGITVLGLRVARSRGRIALPTVKVGRAVMFNTRDVHALLARNTRAA